MEPEFEVSRRAVLGAAAVAVVAADVARPAAAALAVPRAGPQHPKDAGNLPLLENAIAYEDWPI